MKFVDFGDCAIISAQDIRLLPARFQQLPCLAVNAKLGGVCCIYFECFIVLIRLNCLMAKLLIVLVVINIIAFVL